MSMISPLKLAGGYLSNENSMAHKKMNLLSFSLISQFFTIHVYLLQIMWKIMVVGIPEQNWLYFNFMYVLIFLKRSVIKSQTKKVLMEPHKVFGLKLVFPIANNLSTQFVKRKKNRDKRHGLFLLSSKVNFKVQKDRFPSLNTQSCI